MGPLLSNFHSRLAYMIFYFFYKNAAFVMMLFWFQIYCGWSARTPLNDIFLVVFALLFTSLPTIVVGILDQDIHRKVKIL